MFWVHPVGELESANRMIAAHCAPAVVSDGVSLATIPSYVSPKKYVASLPPTAEILVFVVVGLVLKTFRIKHVEIRAHIVSMLRTYI